MTLDIVVEPAAGGGFVARSGAPFDLTAEAATKAEAVGAIRRLADERVRRGARLVQVPVPGTNDLPADAVVGPPPGVNPRLAIAGMWKDDPSLDDFRCEIERYRAGVEPANC